MVDVIEKITVNPNVTSVPHGRGGPVQSAMGTLPEPEAIGSMGGNIGLVDGSVEWRKQRIMHARYVHWAPNPGINIIGHWQSSRANACGPTAPRQKDKLLSIAKQESNMSNHEMSLQLMPRKEPA